MTEIVCRYRTIQNGQPVCEIVSQITDQPLSLCHVNDSACAHCLTLPIPPQAPNHVTASMAIGLAKRSGDPNYLRDMLARMRQYLPRPAAMPTATIENTPCIKRGKVIRQQPCKPCQAGSLTPVLVPVYACPEHGECTLNNTGVQPRIKGCSTCDQRLEKSYQIDTRPIPSVVLAQVHAKQRR